MRRVASGLGRLTFLAATEHHYTIAPAICGAARCKVRGPRCALKSASNDDIIVP